MTAQGKQMTAPETQTTVNVEILVDTICDPHSSVGKEWEHLVKWLPESGFMQSLYWARLKQAQGMRAAHIILRSGRDIVGGALLYTGCCGNGAGILVAPDGPLLPWSDEPLATECLRQIVDAAESLSSTLGAMALRIEPRVQLPAPRLLREFNRSQVDLNPKETLFLDLDRSCADIMSDMKHKGRYNIGLAEKRGVRVVADDSPNAVQRLHNLIAEAGLRNAFFVEPQEFFDDLIENLREAAMPQMFFAEVEGDVIGALLLIRYGRRATYLYGGVSGRKREAMCGYALQWAAIKAAREAGCVEYDLYGFDQFKSPDNQYSRFSQFKEQFGGRVMRFIGAQDQFFVNQLAGAVIKAINQTGSI